MAEIISNKQGKSKRKVHNIKVDLTPMVDLGFLLITFFVITTSLTEPKVANLIMPKDTGPPTNLPASAVLTIMLLENDELRYYNGIIDTAHINSCGFGEIRNIINLTQRVSEAKLGSRNETTVIIKSADSSSYKNLMDIFDEVLINDIRHYYIGEISELEEEKMGIQGVN
jgi:biopolymer transport protein ExbD